MKKIPLKRNGAYNMYTLEGSISPIIHWDEHRKDRVPPRIERSTKTTDFEEARKLIEQWRDEWKKTKIQSKFRSTFAEIRDDFLETKKVDWSPKNLQNVTCDLEKHLIPEFGELLPSEITNQAWLKYVGKCRSIKSRAKEKFFNRRKTLIHVLNFLHELEETNLNYLAKVPEFDDVDPETKAGKYIDSTDVEGMLLKALEDRNQDDIDVLILRTAITIAHKMGPRKGEIIRISKAFVDIGKGFIHLPAEIVKTREARDIKISKHALPLISELMLQCPDNPWLFPSPKYLKDRHVSESHLDHLWEQTKKKQGLTARFHDLRHTCATDMAEGGMPVMLACNQLGMSARVYEKTYMKKRKSALTKAFEAWEGVDP